MIWQAIGNKTPKQIQHSFMKYTAQQIKFDLIENHPLVLDKFRVNAKNRTYQFWERNPLGIELYSHDVFMQKLEYIHWNPVKTGLCRLPEEYYYSSARFYYTGIDEFNMLTHCPCRGSCPHEPLYTIIALSSLYELLINFVTLLNG